MDVSDIKQAFDKVFGDMCLLGNDVALHIFELGYRAGAAANNEACAKVCEVEASVIVTNASEQFQEGRAMGAVVCAEAIRARMK